MNSRYASYGAPATPQSYAPSTYSSGGYSTYYRSPAEDRAREVLEPLIDCIQRYDSFRMKLVTEGGRVADLTRITELLSAPCTLVGRGREHTISLTEQQNVCAAIGDATDYTVRFNVRTVDGDWPAYYLCRTRNDYWSEYSLVVEDLYLSPDYPLPDDRFVKIMDAGHERYYLRASRFRDHVEIHDALSSDSTWQLDEILYDVGRHVLQAAWHEDQRPGILVAQHLDMPHVRQAIELLYLCLSGDLCQLRNSVSDRLLTFFVSIYDQPAIHLMLQKITTLDGAALNDIPKTAGTLYTTLAHSFATFLNTSITWHGSDSAMPLHKIIFANFWRLEHIAPDLLAQECVRASASALDDLANDVIKTITTQT